MRSDLLLSELRFLHEKTPWLDRFFQILQLRDVYFFSGDITLIWLAIGSYPVRWSVLAPFEIIQHECAFMSLCIHRQPNIF